MADSRIETLLENWAGADNEILPPISNNERILQNILGIEGVDIEPIQSRVEALLLQILEQGGGSGGGGGSSDFSTAQVTLICNASDEVTVNLAMTIDAEPPFVPNSETGGYLKLGNGDELTVTAILYKGICDCSCDGSSALSGEGNVTIENIWDAKITGDCTITIS